MTDLKQVKKPGTLGTITPVTYYEVACGLNTTNYRDEGVPCQWRGKHRVLKDDICSELIAHLAHKHGVSLSILELREVANDE